MNRPPRRRVPGLLLLTALTAAAVAFSLFAVAQSYWIDDSFISFRYAKNFSAGHGLVYNAGEVVEGYTNFLWLMFCWLGTTFDFEIMSFAQAGGLICQALTLWATFALGLRGDRPFKAALIAPLLLTAHVAFLTYPMTGMETMAFVMLAAVLGVGLAHGLTKRWIGVLALGLIAAALSTTRFDGFVLVFILLGARFVIDRDWKKAVAVGAVFAILVAGYHAWRLSYYPTPFPNTFYAKTAFSFDRAIDGARYIAGFELAGAWPVFLLAIVPFALRHFNRRIVFCALVVVGQFVYILLVGGDWMPHGRFILPVLPFLLVIAQDGVIAIWSALSTKSPALRGIVIVLFAACWGFVFFPTYQALTVGDVRRGEVHAHWFYPHEAKRIGEHLDAAVPAGALVAIEWGGIIPYYARQPMLDTFGITDREITERKDFRASPYGRFITIEYLASRRPDLVVPCARIFPTEDAARAAIAPDGYARYRFYPELIEKDLGYRLRIMRIAADAYWPAIVRIDGKADE